MDQTKPSRPWRVIAFSTLLGILLVAAIWLLFGSGFGRGPQQGATGQPAATAAGEGGEAALQETGVGPAADAAASEDPLQEEGALPGVDPSGAELQAGELPLVHGKLEALNAAALERAEQGTMTLRLYLVVPTVDVLVPVSREIEAPPTLDSQVQRAVEELIAWTGGEMISPLPAETSVREVWVSPGGIAIVDFDATLPEYLVGGSLEEIHAAYGVVATVTSSFPEIRAVQILVGGEQVDTLDGHVDVSRPLLPLYNMVLTDRRMP